MTSKIVNYLLVKEGRNIKFIIAYSKVTEFIIRFSVTFDKLPKTYQDFEPKVFRRRKMYVKGK